MKFKEVISWSGSAVGTICTALQTDEIMRWIQLSLTILSTLVAIAFTIWQWWKKAKKDGKITPEEVKDLADDINHVLNDKEKGEKDE